jgi:hypothetical protein
MGSYLLLTWSVTEVECVKAPLVPVMVSVSVPSGVDLEVATVRVDVFVADFGEKLQSAPEGHPLTVRPTLPVKPLIADTVTA